MNVPTDRYRDICLPSSTEPKLSGMSCKFPDSRPADRCASRRRLLVFFRLVLSNSTPLSLRLPGLSTYLDRTDTAFHQRFPTIRLVLHWLHIRTEIAIFSSYIQKGRCAYNKTLISDVQPRNRIRGDQVPIVLIDQLDCEGYVAMATSCGR